VDRFLDHWKNVEHQNQRLRRALYGTLLVALIEAWGLGRLAVVPPPIYVIPGTAAVGRYQPDTQWQEVVQQFAEGYVLTLANFTPETAAKSYDASLRYLAPQALSVARSQLTGELDRIKRDRVSSHFSLADAVAVTQQKDTFQATIHGKKRIYAGRELLSESSVAYRLTLAAIPRSTGNPYGLQILAVKQEDTTNHTGGKV
jgi:hypothetical protein